ncbi:MAG: hypothetical protein WBW73_26260 [Rhodoplanes sp.]
MLDRNTELFQEMQAGARIGVLSKDDFEPTATMVVWEATEQGMRAGYEPFPGFEEVKSISYSLPTKRPFSECTTLIPAPRSRTSRPSYADATSYFMSLRRIVR